MREGFVFKRLSQCQKKKKTTSVLVNLYSQAGVVMAPSGTIGFSRIATIG